MANFKKNYHKQQGAVLLMALLVLSLVMFSGVALTTVLMGELRSARYLDAGIVAHYAAESGAERALFLLKEARSPDELSAANPYGQFFDKNGAASFKVDDLFSDNDSERKYDFLKITTTSPEFVSYNIPVNTSVQLDIFNPLEETVEVPDTFANQLTLAWSVPTCNIPGNGSTGSDRLEITKLRYRTGSGATGIIFDPPNPEKDYYPCGCFAGSTQCNPISMVLSQNYFYHLNIRPINNSVLKVSATTQYVDINGSLPPQQIGLPSQIFIQTRGTYRNSSQTVTVQTPWDPATPDLFNYVIFSEASLIKNVLNSTLSSFDSLCGTCADDGLACSSTSDCQSTSQGGCRANTSLTQVKPYCPLDSSGTGLNESSIATDIVQNKNGACNAKCTGFTYCGDGEPQGTATGGNNGYGQNEVCDDGNNSRTDACDSNCTFTTCGDGITQGPDTAGRGPNGAGLYEVCDDGCCDTPANHANPNCKVFSPASKCNGNGIEGVCDAACSSIQHGSSNTPPCKKNCLPPV